ncbi:MAG: helix-turn-helix transcriptional regulator [Oscillospiraceae bacterium]|nr:helix-turn-helix transcriptional regulator [Oscillospiraceae bacterium]
MEMSAAEKVRTLMARKNISMGDMAEGTGQSRQNLSNKMKRGNFSEKELEAMAAVLGCTVQIRFMNSNGEVEL